VAFGLQADYARAVTDFLKRILDETDANVLFVPHVFTRQGHFEHDPDACASVAATLGEATKQRVACLPAGLSPGKTKWAIGRTDWFCGTRMHASIAAISSGVPASAIAYSDKTLGVFETCGQGEHVADLRYLETGEVVDRLWESWETRSWPAVPEPGGKEPTAHEDGTHDVSDGRVDQGDDARPMLRDHAR
jgi:polysaccharide pyruvyl transferase WcaK-like protein